MEKQLEAEEKLKRARQLRSVATSHQVDAAALNTPCAGCSESRATVQSERAVRLCFATELPLEDVAGSS